MVLIMSIIFRTLRQKMKGRVAPRTKRTDAMRLRGVLERLEERAMLSAYGLMDFGHGGQDFRPRMEAGSRFNDSAAVALKQQRSMSYDKQTLSNGPEFGGRHGEMQYRTPMQRDFRPQYSFPRPNWNDVFTGPPLAFIFFEESPHFDSPSSDSHGILLRVTSKSPSLVVPPKDILDPLNSFNRSSGDNHFQTLLVALDQVKNTIPSGVAILANSSTLPDVRTGLQNLSRETNTGAALTTVAREQAFQEFSSRLFQSNATNSYDPANLNGLGTESTQPEMLDGFIEPPDGSMVDATVSSSDAMMREREAIDAILDELHDPDTFLPTTASTVINLRVDLKAETALNEMPADEVDGGMVLLQSTGDANGSLLDLTPVYADHFHRSDRPTKMETSVGMFQAVDVLTDDAPLNETAPQMESTSRLSPEVKIDQNVPIKREPSSSSKAAALVGATSLTGALVWLSRCGRHFTLPQSTAQKRRPARR